MHFNKFSTVIMLISEFSEIFVSSTIMVKKISEEPEGRWVMISMRPRRNFSGTSRNCSEVGEGGRRGRMGEEARGEEGPARKDREKRGRRGRGREGKAYPRA
jgi:hypothetical protein